MRTTCLTDTADVGFRADVRAFISTHLPEDLKAKSVSGQRLTVQDGRRWHPILELQGYGSSGDQLLSLSSFSSGLVCQSKRSVRTRTTKNMITVTHATGVTSPPRTFVNTRKNAHAPISGMTR